MCVAWGLLDIVPVQGYSLLICETFQLLQELPIRNTLDVMHIERNVSDNVIRHLFRDKDTLETRRDMA